MNEGRKNDDGKLRYDLLPPDALEGVVAVLTYGCKKYSDRNWENGIKYGRVFAALMRHMWAWWRGEENDVETGLSHLDHAHCCILFLYAYTNKKHLQSFDDRPSGGSNIDATMASGNAASFIQKEKDITNSWK